MTTKVLLLLGTKKGAFIFESDRARNDWQLRGLYCEAWPINHVIADPETGVIYAGGGNAWFGPAVWKTTDFGANWTHSSEGLAYGEGEAPVSSVWSLANGAGRLYAAFDAKQVRDALGGATLLLDEEVISVSSGKIIHRIVARRDAHR